MIKSLVATIAFLEKQQGNFGHAGRPGQRGGSAKQEQGLPEDVKPYQRRKLTEAEISRLASNNGMVNVRAIPNIMHNWAVAEDWRAQEHGPYYENGQLHIPAIVFDETKSKAGAAEWKRRGLWYDKPNRRWSIDVPVENAVEQVRKARGLFDKIWGYQRDASGKITNQGKRTGYYQDGRFIETKK